MPMFTIANHVNVSLISLNIAPSTAITLTILLFIYLYIIHSRDHPLLSDNPKQLQQANPRPLPPIHEPCRIEQNNDNDYRRAGRPLRRSSFFGRLSTRLRTPTKKQRDRAALPPPATPPTTVIPSTLWLSFPSFGFPFGGQRGGSGRLNRQILPAGVETRRKRKEKQRLLEW